MAVETFVLDFSDFQMPSVTIIKKHYRFFAEHKTRQNTYNQITEQIIPHLMVYLNNKAEILSKYINKDYPIRYSPPRELTRSRIVGYTESVTETYNTVPEKFYFNVSIPIKICGSLFKNSLESCAYDLYYYKDRLCESTSYNSGRIYNRKDFIDNIDYSSNSIDNYFVERLIYHIQQQTGKSVLDQRVLDEAKQRGIGKDKQLLAIEEEERKKQQEEQDKKNAPIIFQRKCEKYADEHKAYLKQYHDRIREYNLLVAQAVELYDQIIKSETTELEKSNMYADIYNKICESKEELNDAEKAFLEEEKKIKRGPWPYKGGTRYQRTLRVRRRGRGRSRRGRSNRK